MNDSLKIKLKIARAWCSMISRCYDLKNSAWHWYGGRGISVCEEWRCNIESFIEDIGVPPSLTHSIDRIDVNGDYEPFNCVWATQEEQNSNTRRNRYLDYMGESKTIKEWSKLFDLDPRRVSERIRRGWSIDKALRTSTPLKFEEARCQYKAENAKFWRKNGKKYRKNAKSKRLASIV